MSEQKQESQVLGEDPVSTGYHHGVSVLAVLGSTAIMLDLRHAVSLPAAPSPSALVIIVRAV